MSLSNSPEHNTINSIRNSKFNITIFYLDSLSSINVTNQNMSLINVKFEPLTVRGIGGEETCSESGRFKDKFEGLRFHFLKTCHFNIVGLTKLEERFTVVKNDSCFVCTSKLNPNCVVVFDRDDYGFYSYRCCLVNDETDP